MFRVAFPLAFSACLMGTTAFADLTLRFDEGAPKDRFTLTNAGSCALPALQVTIDLGTAPAGLIFDVTGGGAGVEVFQPFEVVAGRTALVGLPQVLDGDNAVTLDLRGMAAGADVAFTVDVDDTAGGREITVSGSEIAGASVRLLVAGQQYDGVMTAQAEAVVPMQACTS